MGNGGLKGTQRRSPKATGSVVGVSGKDCLVGRALSHSPLQHVGVPLPGRCCAGPHAWSSSSARPLPCFPPCLPAQARAKGLPERTVIGKHALRNTLIPIVTIVGLQFGNLFAGAILVETVFSWPGLGRLVFESILRRDYPTLLAVLFFSALLVMVANIITDFVYRMIDPRIQARVG